MGAFHVLDASVTSSLLTTYLYSTEFPVKSRACYQRPGRSAAPPGGGRHAARRRSPDAAPRGPQACTSGQFTALQAVRLLDQLRERIRMLHYSLRTEQAYLYWCRAFIRFHGLRHRRRWAARRLKRY